MTVLWKKVVFICLAFIRREVDDQHVLRVVSSRHQRGRSDAIRVRGQVDRCPQYRPTMTACIPLHGHSHKRTLCFLVQEKVEIRQDIHHKRWCG